jgi:hypothetical protein
MRIKDMQKKPYMLEVDSPSRGMRHTVQTHAVSSVRARWSHIAIITK